MNKEKDSLMVCPKTNGNFCYKREIAPGINKYMSMSSGFWTNSLMRKDQQFYKEQIELLPELHKEVAWEDPKTGLIWIPQTIMVDDKGMVFCNNDEKNGWVWSAVRVRKLTPEEQKLKQNQKPNGEPLTFKPDMNTKMDFAQDEFMNAMSYIQIFND